MKKIMYIAIVILIIILAMRCSCETQNTDMKTILSGIIEGSDFR